MSKKERNNKKINIRKDFDVETGEIKKEVVEIELNENIHKIDVKTKEEHKKAVEYKKKEEYKEKGKKEEHFAQTTHRYEQEVVGKYSAKKLECLVKLLPYMNYNGNEELNKFDVIKIGKKNANTKMIAEVLGIHRETAAIYLREFVEDKILEEVKTNVVNGNNYRFNAETILKGNNKMSEFTKKIVLEKLSKVIEICNTEVKKSMAKEQRKKKPRFKTLYPLALLGALVSKTHFKTFFLLNNHEDNSLVKDEEKVTEALAMTKRYRKFKFLKNKDMWNLYSGQELEKVYTKEKAELDECINILIKANALGRWETGKKTFLLINPSLVFVSPNMKCDDNWKQVIKTLFNIGSEEFNDEE